MDTDQSITMSHINARIRSCIAAMDTNDPMWQTLIDVVDEIDKLIGTEERKIWERIFSEGDENT